MENNETGKTIAALRKDAGFTQKELADALCVTDKAVSKWERGVACPDISLLPKLSALLDCDIEPILNGISTIHSCAWSGVLVLEDGVDVGCSVYDKPMVYYLLSPFLLCGIRNITVACTEKQGRKIREVLESEMLQGISLNFTANFDKENLNGQNLLIVRQAYFLFGASLTRQLQAFMSSQNNTQVYESNGNPLSIYFMKSKDAGDYEKKMFNRGIVTIPLTSFDTINDASNFVRICQTYSNQKISDLYEISANRNLLEN